MNAETSPCTNPVCKFETDGNCVEGVAENCPFRRGRRLIEPVSEAPADDFDYGQTADEADPFELHSGNRLRLVDAPPILQAARSNLICIVGPSRSGKSSLIAGLYELFLNGQQPNMLFRSSRTLLEFERMCHRLRETSGQTEPDMERTKLASGLGLYHLEVMSRGERINLLLADRPGEDFLSASASLGAIASLEEVERCAVLTLLVDGAALLANATKHLPQTNAISVLEAMTQAGKLGHTPRLAIILTKFDLAVDDGPRQTVDERFNRVVDVLERRFGTHFGEIKAYRVAATPFDDETLPPGYGLAALLDDWIEPAPVSYSRTRVIPPSTRAFEQFQRPEGEEA